MDITIILLSFVAALVLTFLVRKNLLRRNLLDHPNERSSHTQPVPRGGGWALLLVLIPGIIITGVLQHDIPRHAGLLTGIILLGIISWLDDKGGVSARVRLSLHLLAATLGTLSFSQHAVLFGGFLPLHLDRAIMIIGWAWFINLYNFMDGIDGITGVETISIATGTCLLMTAIGTNDPFLATLTLLLTGSCLGFLVFNWHPAKIFLGDVGSVPLGYLIGFGLITLAVNGHLVSALILPLYYLADSGITITKRALRGEKFWEAHRQHFYQRAAKGLGRHDRVVYRITVTNIALIGLSLLALSCPVSAATLAVVIVALLLWNMHKVAHGTSEP